MKRKISLGIAIVLGILFITICMGLADIHLYYSNTFFKNMIWIDIIWGLCLCVLLCCIHLCNRIYDQTKQFYVKKMVFDRWSQNVVFVSLIGIFLFVYLYYRKMYAYTPYETNTYLLMSAFMLAIVLASAIYYWMQYKNLLPTEKRIQKLLRPKQRYTFLVGEVKEENGIVTLQGIVDGTMDKDDAHCLYMKNENIHLIKHLQIIKDGKQQKSVTDGFVEIRIQQKELKKPISKYSVITNTLEKVGIIKENRLDMPITRALISGYIQYGKDPSYMTQMLQVIQKSRYLLGASAVDSKQRSVVEPLLENAKLSFASVVAKMDDLPVSLLPVFTDWDAMQRWESLMKNSQAVSLIYSYQETYGIMKQGFDGIVINPFGPHSFVIPKDLAEEILHLQ